MSSILYITYDGLLEPLGMSQVWQYVRKLSKDHKIIIVSFEKDNNVNDLDSVIKDVEFHGVSWYRLKYHKRPSLLATTYDVLIGFVFSFYLIKKRGIDVIHARSYVPSLIALMLNITLKTKFLFDMRGFWADEKVDGGTWGKRSLIYKIVKSLECSFFQRCSSVVSLTNAGKKDISSLHCMKNANKDIVVIPTCVNMNTFNCNNYSISNKSTRDFDLVLGYIGSVGTFYLFDEVLKSLACFNKYGVRTKLLIVNRGQHEYIGRKIFESKIDKKYIEIKSASYKDIPNEICKVDAGIFYIKPTFSKRSSSPTRLGEFLSCGKPCISNYGVGDTKHTIESNNVGVILNGFLKSDHKSGVEKLLKLITDKDLKNRCLSVAKNTYSLDMGVKRYSCIYSKINK